MKNLKLMIVEDEILIGLQLKTDLSRAGYAVIGPVSTGSEAVSLAQSEKPDIVVLDLRVMGALDGIETARQLNAIFTPWIMFTTGYQDLDLKEVAMEFKPLAYLVKPVDWRDIDTAVRSKV